MSWSIQPKSIVGYLPQGSPDLRGQIRYDDELFWFVKIGSNNISPFTPRWNLQKRGENYEVVQEVCRQAGYCEGGSLKFGSRPDAARWITPEEYIADFREKVAAKKVLTLSFLKSVGHSSIGFSNIKKTMLDEPLAVEAVNRLNDFERSRLVDVLEELTNNFVMEEEIRFGDKDEKTFTFRQKLSSVDDFLRWIHIGEVLKPFNIWTATA